MPNIKVISQTTQTTSVTGAYNTNAVSLDGAFTVSAQVNVTSVSTPSGATTILQVSNDDLTVTPSNWTDYGSSQNVTATGSLFFEKINPTGNWIRAKFAISSGSFAQSTVFVVKGPN
jgi:hypothetical protein